MSEEYEDLGTSLRETGKDLAEKKEVLEDLKNDRKHYDQKLKKARSQLEAALTNLYGKKVTIVISYIGFSSQ